MHSNIDWFKQTMKEIEYQLADFAELRNTMNPRKETLKIIMIYLIIGSLWILFSDYSLNLLIPDPVQFKAFQLYKGWLYVLVSGIVFFAIILCRLKLFKHALDQLSNEYQRLKTYNQKILEVEQQLLSQYELLDHQKRALENSDQRHKLVVEGSNDGIWEWDLETHAFYSSITLKPQYQFQNTNPHRPLQAWLDLLHPEDRDNAYQRIQDFIDADSDVYENAFRICTGSGETRWIHSRAVAIRDSNGKAIKMAGSHTDITEKIEMDEFLHHEKALLEKIIEKAPVMITLMDQESRIVRLNPMAESITGYTEKEAQGKNLIDLLSPVESRLENQQLFKAMMKGDILDHSNIKIRCKNGQESHTIWYNSPIRDKYGNLKYLLSVGLDDTKNRLTMKTLHEMAYFDPLTKLPNRSYFREEVQRQLMIHDHSDTSIVIVQMDLDNFKHINDSIGIEAGEILLCEFADRLRKRFGPPDIVARIGGDEFAMMLVTNQNLDYLSDQMNLVADELRFKWTCREQQFYVSASMGMAVYPAHGCDFNTLEISADTALFHAKEHARGKCVLFVDHMRDNILSAIQMTSLIRTALEQDRFSLVYQPIMDLTTGDVVGAEALIRLKDSNDQPVSPTVFIPFAEQHGFIHAISEWVFKTATRQKSIWNKRGYKDLKISINLSGKSLIHSQLSSTLEKYLKMYHLQPWEIDLEITETAIIEDLELSLKILNQLKDEGYSISLDDFGTGYSSLTYLNRLPIDTVKIDREFVNQVTHEDAEVHLLQSIIDLAHQLGLKVVAEGVETQEQFHYLLKNGCDSAQGYYFCKPATPEAFETFLNSETWQCIELFEHVR